MVIVNFWLSDWQTDAISVWLTVDHGRHFAVASFFFVAAVLYSWSWNFSYCCCEHLIVGELNHAYMTEQEHFLHVLNYWVLPGSLLHELGEHGNFLNTDISQGSVDTLFRYGCIIKCIFLQIYYWVWQWKNFENPSTFGKVMCKSIVSCFLLTHRVHAWHLLFCSMCSPEILICILA